MVLATRKADKSMGKCCFLRYEIYIRIIFKTLLYLLIYVVVFFSKFIIIDKNGFIGQKLKYQIECW